MLQIERHGLSPHAFLILGALMKAILITVFALATLSAHATGIKSAVENFERENNARCMEMKKTLSVCLGTMGNCFYTVKYNCASPEGDFRMKIKVRDLYDYRTQTWHQTVRKVIRID